MNEKIKLVILAILGLVIISLFSYQDKVIETIEDRVTPECLKK